MAFSRTRFGRRLFRAAVCWTLPVVCTLVAVGYLSAMDAALAEVRKVARADGRPAVRMWFALSFGLPMYFSIQCLQNRAHPIPAPPEAGRRGETRSRRRFPGRRFQGFARNGITEKNVLQIG